MIKTILFDLDGTLLPIDMNKFIEQYLKGLSLKFKDHFEPKELSKLILLCTSKMIESNENEKTNAEVFFENFYKITSNKPEIIDPVFEDYYINEFSNLKKLTKENELIKDSIKILKEKGYELVVATNPLFPKKAITNRIGWAGLNEQDFSFITSFEIMHYCKPNTEYYKEILEYIGKDSKECMMIGNDVEEDMVAKEIGLQTYLIEDHIIKRGNDLSNVDYKGNYQDFYNFVLKLPKRG